MGILTIMFPFFVVIFVLNRKAKLKEEPFNQRYSSLYENIDTKRRIALIYCSFFTLRRLINAIILVFLRDYPIFQVQVLMINSLLLNIHLIYNKPLISLNYNKLEIFNELCVLACSYHLLFFTDSI